MNKITLEVIQPTKTKISGKYDHIIIPGIDGDFGVDWDHTPFITKIRPGILRIYFGKKIEEYAIHDRFVSVENNKVKIVCEIIEDIDEIDLKRATSSKDRAEKRLKSTSDDIDFRRAEIALKKALVRISLKKE